MKIAVINNDKPQCGVFQMGMSVYHALLEFSHHEVHLFTVSDQNNFLKQLNDMLAFDAVLFNYHPLIYPWLTRALVGQLSSGPIVVCINHEFDHMTAYAAYSDLFHYRLAFDPSLKSRCPNVAVIPRIVAQKKINKVKNGIFTVGTFGFTTGGKNFEKLIFFAKSLKRPCLLNLHLPFSAYCDADGMKARNIVLQCKELGKNDNITVKANHEFFDNDTLVDWLASNDLNIFLYADSPGRGISSVLDYALAAETPVALSDTTMFRHVKAFAPELFLSENSIDNILAVGAESARRLKQLWTPKNAVMRIEEAIGSFINDHKKSHRDRLNTVLDDNLRDYDAPHINEMAALCRMSIRQRSLELMCNRLLLRRR